MNRGRLNPQPQSVISVSNPYYAAPALSPSLLASAAGLAAQGVPVTLASLPAIPLVPGLALLTATV